MFLATPHLQRNFVRSLYPTSNRAYIFHWIYSSLIPRNMNQMTANRRSISSASSGIDTPAKPRPSASLLLLNSKNEVLMIQRTKESRTFAGMHAFPGGNLDEAQDGNDPRITAIRETFEETGILLASLMCPPNAAISASGLSRARSAIHSRTDPLTFPEFTTTNYLSVDPVLDYLIPFSQWITPSNAKSRYSTQFYVAFLEELGEAVHIAEEFEPTLSGSLKGAVTEGHEVPVAKIPAPSHDNHVEILTAYFQPPREILQSFEQGAISLMPPQYYLLTTLSELLETSSRGDNDTASSFVHNYVRRTVERSFGSRIFNPKFGSRSVGKDGVARSVLMYEGDGEYYGNGSTETNPANREMNSRRHRSLVSFKDGRPAFIQLERNINILKDEEDVHRPTATAKL